MLVSCAGNCVVNLLCLIKIKTHFHAFSCCYPAGMLKLLPWNIVSFWSDKRKYISFATVFAHKRRGKSYTTHRLKFCSNPEHRSRKHMHFIINDKSPCSFSKQSKMWIRSVFFRAPRKNLVRCNGYRLDCLFFASIFGNLFASERCLVNKLVNPLVDCRNICRYDKRICLKHRHNFHTDYCLARSARKYNRTKTSTRPFVAYKRFRAGPLICSDDKIRAGSSLSLERYVKMFAVNKRNIIFYRPTYF